MKVSCTSSDEGSSGFEPEASPAIHLSVAVEVDDGVMAGGVDISIAALQHAVVVDAMGASRGEHPIGGSPR